LAGSDQDLIDGEGIVSDDSGLAVFDLIRSFRHDHAAALCAFDLLEVDGQDLRRLPIEIRKAGLTQLLRSPHPGIALNEHYVGEGEIVYEQACKLGCEGIVSKRLGSLYRSGRSKHWVKVKNPAAPALRREAGTANARLGATFCSIGNLIPWAIRSLLADVGLLQIGFGGDGLRLALGQIHESNLSQGGRSVWCCRYTVLAW
jgi:hypothetical protein